MDDRIIWYETEAGRCPIEEFLNSLPADRARDNCIAYMQELAEPGPPLPPNHAEKVRGELWELKPAYKREEYRILYARVSGNRYIMLHAVKKKRQRLAGKEFDLAEQRLADYRRRVPD